MTTNFPCLLVEHVVFLITEIGETKFQWLNKIQVVLMLNLFIINGQKEFMLTLLSNCFTEKIYYSQFWKILRTSQCSVSLQFDLIVKKRNFDLVSAIVTEKVLKLREHVRYLTSSKTMDANAVTCTATLQLALSGSKNSEVFW